MATDKVILHPSGCTSTELYPKTTIDQVFFSDSANLSSIIPSTAGTFAISNTSGTIGATAIANMPAKAGTYILTVTGTESLSYSYSEFNVPVCDATASGTYHLKCEVTGTSPNIEYSYSWEKVTQA